MTMEMKPTCEQYHRLKVMKNEILKFIKGKGVKNMMYDNMETVAVPCNNVVECRDSEDEQWLCASSAFLSSIVKEVP